MQVEGLVHHRVLFQNYLLYYLTLKPKFKCRFCLKTYAKNGKCLKKHEASHSSPQLYSRKKKQHLETMSAKTSRAGIWGVGRSFWDQFFRIPHTKIG
jgi:hypothetical protein